MAAPSAVQPTELNSASVQSSNAARQSAALFADRVSEQHTAIARWEWFAFSAIVLASLIWCVGAAWQLGATFDEPVYITQGLQHWRTGSHAGLMYLGTMPLPIDLANLPLYLYERWQGRLLDPTVRLGELLPLARAVTLLFWSILLGYGWRIGRDLAGPLGGLLSAALLAFEPTMLAHASLATTDVALAACLLPMLYYFRAGRESAWQRRVAIPAVWFGAAVLSKASALVFGPLCLLAVEVERVARLPTTPRRFYHRAGAVVNRLRPFRRDLWLITVSGLAIAFFYCGCDWQPEPSFVAWAQGLPAGPLGTSMRYLARHLRIFTNAGDGLVRQLRHNLRGQGPLGAYLLGNVKRAFWYYFPVTLTIKLSIPLLALPIAVAIISPLALLNWPNLAAATLFACSPLYRVQIGIRLVLPLVALAAVGTGASVVRVYEDERHVWTRRALAAGAVAGVLSTLYAAAAVFPNGLCYTNSLWGGTGRGYQYLSDSNYDWGQGLPELARWQRAHPQSQVDVWYFGTDPTLERLPLHALPRRVFSTAQNTSVAALEHGRYLAVSTTFLYGVAEGGEDRKAIDYLRKLQPAARTTTFFIYDFTK